MIKSPINPNDYRDIIRENIEAKLSLADTALNSFSPDFTIFYFVAFVCVLCVSLALKEYGTNNHD